MSGPRASLARALARGCRGEVRFDAGARALYATDASNYRQVPIGVVVPRDVEDLVRAVEVCRDHDAPILTRGGGTSLAGQCCNVAVVLDVSKHLRGVLELDPARRIARVLPGTVLDALRAETEPLGLTFGPDPATHAHCTIGGMIGNDSCGVHAQMAGRTADNVEELLVLTCEGTRLRVGPTRVASEGAVVIADGFSCRYQIEAGTGHRARHLAELIRDVACRLPSAGGRRRSWAGSSATRSS